MKRYDFRWLPFSNYFNRRLCNIYGILRQERDGATIFQPQAYTMEVMYQALRSKPPIYSLDIIQGIHNQRLSWPEQEEASDDMNLAKDCTQDF